MRRIKGKILSRFAHDLDFPSDIYSGGFRTELFSDSEAVVYGVKSICDYTADKIVLRHKSGYAVFCGIELSCDSYVEGVVCVRGSISSLHFEKQC